MHVRHLHRARRGRFLRSRIRLLCYLDKKALVEMNVVIVFNLSSLCLCSDMADMKIMNELGKKYLKPRKNISTYRNENDAIIYEIPKTIGLTVCKLCTI